MQLYSES